MIIKINIKLLAILLITVFVIQINAQKIINVAMATNQPPYTFTNGEGLVKDILNEFNRMQDDFNFVLQILPAERSRIYLNDSSIDMIFSNISWGYNREICVKSIDILNVKDKYFTHKDFSTNQDYFKKIGVVKTVVVNGFHYSFLNKIKDQRILKEDFNTITVTDEPTVIKIILHKRANIGISSSTTLDYFKKTNPGFYDKLLISDTNDTEYKRHFVLNKNSELDIQTLDNMLQSLIDNGKLIEILSGYGLENCFESYDKKNYTY